jgi:ubiquinone/menaquinone biosynthesis C-methylase UbiE
MHEDVDPAVRIHDEQAGLFAMRYQAMADDPYYDVFSYTRKKIDEVLDEQLAAVSGVARLLDVGCGTGHQLSKYAARGFVCAGCDPSLEMLSRARASNPDIHLARADARALPYPNAAFDVLLSIEVMRYLATPQDVLREFARVLAPGGLALVTFAPKFSTSLYPLVNKLTSRVRIGELSKVKQYFHTSQELQTMFRRAGFESVTVVPRFYGPFIHVNRINREAASRWLRRWERRDDAIGASGRFGNLSNLFVVVARRPPK